MVLDFKIAKRDTQLTMSGDEDLAAEVRQLREAVDALHRRLDSIETVVDREVVGQSSRLPSSQTNDSGTRDGSSTGEAANTVGSTQETTSASTESAGEPSGRGATKADDDWELSVGIQWLGVAGGLALVFAVFYFVQIAIDRGLLGPLGRVTIGTLGGLVLLVGGRYAATRLRYERWGRIAAAAGLGITYFSIYAAYGYDTYREAIGTPLWSVVTALTLLVALTAIVSVRDRAPMVAGEAFLFGYITAFLSTDATTLLLTPVYVLLLVVGLIAIATVRPWAWLVAVSVFGTFGVVMDWVSAYSPSSLALGTVAVSAYLLYLVGNYTLRRHDRFDERRFRASLVSLTILTALFASFMFELATADVFSESGLVGFGTASVALTLAGFYVLTDRDVFLRQYTDAVPVQHDAPAAVMSVVLLAGGIGLMVLTSSSFGTFTTTVSALAIICLAVGIASVDDAPAFRIGAHIVAGALALKLVFVDANELAGFEPAEPMATLTGRPVVFGLSVAVFYALAWLFTCQDSTLLDVERGETVSVNGHYALGATLLAILTLALELSGLGLSMALALFGFALLGIGLAADVRGVRALGVGVLGLTTSKVFLVDTTGLDIVPRTLAFLALGAILLTGSYLYARSRTDTDIDFPRTN